MSSDPAPQAARHPISRRAFLQGGTTAAVALALGRPAPAAPAASTQPAVQWRNKQSGMAYRRLGRTGYMISEVVSGGDPIDTRNYKHLELALDMGLNYLDMAPLYARGDCEAAYGKLIAGSGKRERVFLNTKISWLDDLRNRLYKEIFDGLGPARQEAYLKRAKAMRAERGVEKPGYYLDYFPGQRGQFDGAYLSNAMMKDFGHKVEGSEKFRKHIIETLEGSLKRVGTDYFDLVMCPHGATSPEEAHLEVVFETFAELKKQGKARALGVSSHNDPAAVLRVAAQNGQYDVVMVAYNVCNGGYVEEALRAAGAKDIGIIAMKSAMSVATHHKSHLPVPQWRIEKINRIIPGDMKPPMKAYLWSLQNPHVSAVVSNLWNETFVRENLSLAGKKVELQSA